MVLQTETTRIFWWILGFRASYCINYSNIKLAISINYPFLNTGINVAQKLLTFFPDIKSWEASPRFLFWRLFNRCETRKKRSFIFPMKIKWFNMFGLSRPNLQLIYVLPVIHSYWLQISNDLHLSWSQFDHIVYFDDQNPLHWNFSKHPWNLRSLATFLWNNSLILRANCAVLVIWQNSCLEITQTLDLYMVYKIWQVTRYITVRLQSRSCSFTKKE